MATAATSTTPKRSSCFCNHCNTPAKRTELDGRFLCATCRTIPGIRGYRDPNKRGLERDINGRNSVDYWNATRHQLNVVTEDNPAPVTPRPPVDPEPAAKPQRALTEVEKWRDAVSVSALLPEVKLCLLRLEQLWGDYRTGASICPTEQAIAAALGCTRWQVRRFLRLAGGWVALLPLKRRRSGENSVHLYQLRRPVGAKHGPWEGPVRCKAKGLVLALQGRGDGRNAGVA